MADLPPGCAFDFSVTNPEKKGSGAFAHWVYTIHTTTSLPTFKQKKLVTVKRYSHFVWLRDQLVVEHPGCIVPPIPEKDFASQMQRVAGSNEPTELVAYRQRALRKFLVRVGAHPKLQKATVMHDFLQLSEEDFAKRMKEPLKKAFDIMSMPSTVKIAGGMAAKSNSPDYAQWWDTIAYFDKLEFQLGEVRSKVNKLMHARLSTGLSFRDFGMAYVAAGEVEADKQSQEVGSMMKLLGDLSRQQTPACEEQASNECVHVAESVTYYQGMCTSVKDAIKRLVDLQQTRDWLATATKKAERKRDTDSDVKSAEKASQLDDNHSRAVAAARDVGRELTEELARFHREKAYDLKMVLSTFVELTRDYSGKQKAAWESLTFER